MPLKSFFRKPLKTNTGQSALPVLSVELPNTLRETLRTALRPNPVPNLCFWTCLLGGKSEVSVRDKLDHLPTQAKSYNYFDL